MAVLDGNRTISFLDTAHPPRLGDGEGIRTILLERPTPGDGHN